MNVTSVESTTLLTVAYDESRKLLQLEFRNRAVYPYYGVPAAVHKALLRAPSKGSYLNRVLRGRLPYWLVSKSNADVREGLLAQCRR